MHTLSLTEFAPPTHTHRCMHTADNTAAIHAHIHKASYTLTESHTYTQETINTMATHTLTVHPPHTHTHTETANASIYTQHTHHRALHKHTHIQPHTHTHTRISWFSWHVYKYSESSCPCVHIHSQRITHPANSSGGMVAHTCMANNGPLHRACWKVLSNLYFHQRRYDGFWPHAMFFPTLKVPIFMRNNSRVGNSHTHEWAQPVVCAAR